MADYNKTNTADQTDSFAATNLPAAADVVKSVNVKVFALKEQAPTPTTVKALVRTGSTPTDYSGMLLLRIFTSRKSKRYGSRTLTLLLGGW